MSIPNLFIIGNAGEVLIEKHWEGKVKRNVCDLFWEETNKCSSKPETSPLIYTPKYVLIHVYRFNLSFLTAVTKEVPPLLVIEALHRIIDVFLMYFNNCLSETILKENFSIVYQLLDEMVDGGFPSTTEPNQLMEMIYPPSLARRVMQTVSNNFAVTSELPQGALTKIPWRKSNVRYVTNEIYFDLIEQIDAVINTQQQVLSSQVFGDIRVNCRLSGMPDLTLTFTKPNLLNDCSLHRCVRINRYQRERVISFVPPDGIFKLLSYRISGNIMLPIFVKPVITYHQGGGRVSIQVGPRYTQGKVVTDVAINIPFPAALVNTSLTVNHGIIKHDQKTKVTRWEIGRLPKDRTPSLTGSITLLNDFIPDENPTLTAEFAIKMLSSSGLKVDGLAIRGVKYQPFKGVRTLTQAGRFQIRCGK